MIYLLLALACGPATYTNPTDQPLEVAVQLGEGYVETVIEPGDTIEYWEAAPGRSWAVWDSDGNLLAEGAQCGEEVNMPEIIPPQVLIHPIVDDTERHVSFPAPYLAAWVRPL